MSLCPLCTDKPPNFPFRSRSTSTPQGGDTNTLFEAEPLPPWLGLGMPLTAALEISFLAILLFLFALGIDFLESGATGVGCSLSATGSCLPSLVFSLSFDLSFPFSDAILGAKALPSVSCAMPFRASLGLELLELLGVTGLWFPGWASGWMGQT